MTNTNEVRIETSTLCNYRCKFCPHHTHFNRKKEIMTNDLFTFLLQKVKYEAPFITECTISGFGEAFTDKNIIEKFNIANQLGFNTHLVTNGSLLTKEHIDKLYNIITDIRISLHTVIEKEYKKITGGNKKQFNNVIDIIEYIIQNKIKLILTADIVKDNEKNINDFIAKYNGRVDLIEVWKPHNWADWGKYRNTKNLLKKLTCGRPENGPLQIQVDGTVNMCCFDYNGNLELGDFKTQSLNEIFTSDIYNKIKEKHIHGGISGLLCDNCDQLCTTSDAVIFNSKYSAKERIKQLSTTHKNL